MDKLLPKYAFFIIKALNYAFLIAILKEHLSEAAFVISIFLGIGVLLYSYSKFEIQTASFKVSDLLILPFIFSGAISTYILTVETSFSVILAASLVGTIGAFIPKRYLFKEAPTAIYCGVFIGMTAPFLVGGYGFIFGASLLSSILYLGSEDFLKGFGGKLGALAFGGVCLMSLFMYLTGLL